MEEKVVLIDGNSLLNRAYFALPVLNSEDGVNVNAVYGFSSILLRILKDVKPTSLVVAFDLRGDNFRKALYSEYKANRKGMPDDLFAQMPVLHELLETMKIKIVEQAGVEADDLIGTLSKRFKRKCYVVSGDRDMLQLVDENVSVLLTKKGITEVEEVTKDNIFELYSLTAEQIADYKALRGDTSDNIPGVKGIGEKTATALLNQYGSLDGVYQHVDEIKGAVKDKLLADKEMAYLSQKLATIVTDADIDCELESCTLPVFDEKVKSLLEKLKFKSILQRLELAPKTTVEKEESAPKVEATQKRVNTLSELDELLQRAENEKEMAFVWGENVHLSFDGKTEYVLEIAKDMFGELSEERIFEAVKPLLEGKTEKTVYDVKSLLHRLDAFNVELNNCKYDVMLMNYLAQASSAKTLEELTSFYGYEQRACGLFVLGDYLQKRLTKLEMTHLYWDMELPLTRLLYEMECEGVKVDVECLNGLSQDFKKQIDELTQKIYALAGEKFNVSSTKQLGVILFDKLRLRHQKKTKSGYSTDSDVLKKLYYDHEIIPLIIAYREFSKLYSTYIEGLRPLVKRGVVHTTYNQALTTTGRLSSTEPNLQNIPIRNDLGKEIRKLFVSKHGVFVGADYSQIELRLVAAFSEDENLLNAFKNGEDIHTKVATEIMGIPAEMVKPEMRRVAKAVNFGIIYGISSYGLAESTGLGVGSASDYMVSYFERFPKVKKYLNDCVAFAKQHGYAVTHYNRRRLIPELKSTNKNVVGFGERVAKNMPLQGSAADIMKTAMLNVDKALKEKGLKSKLVLQIHDELLVDTYLDEVDEVKRIVKEQMEGAASLACPLSVELEEGETLFEV